jgi:hypothetical protein
MRAVACCDELLSVMQLSTGALSDGLGISVTDTRLAPTASAVDDDDESGGVSIAEPLAEAGGRLFSFAFSALSAVSKAVSHAVQRGEEPARPSTMEARRFSAHFAAPSSPDDEHSALVSAVTALAVSNLPAPVEHEWDAWPDEVAVPSQSSVTAGVRGALYTSTASLSHSVKVSEVMGAAPSIEDVSTLDLHAGDNDGWGAFDEADKACEGSVCGDATVKGTVGSNQVFSDQLLSLAPSSCAHASSLYSVHEVSSTAVEMKAVSLDKAAVLVRAEASDKDDDWAAADLVFDASIDVDGSSGSSSSKSRQAAKLPQSEVSYVGSGQTHAGFGNLLSAEPAFSESAPVLVAATNSTTSMVSIAALDWDALDDAVPLPVLPASGNA